MHRYLGFQQSDLDVRVIQEVLHPMLITMQSLDLVSLMATLWHTLTHSRSDKIALYTSCPAAEMSRRTATFIISVDIHFRLS